MSTIQTKAQAILDQITGAPPTPPAITPTGSGTLLQTIIQILLSVLNGASLCGGTAAGAHKLMTNPGPLQKRSLKRTVRRSGVDPSLEVPVYEATLSVGSGLTLADSTAMLKEAQGQ